MKRFILILALFAAACGQATDDPDPSGCGIMHEVRAAEGYTGPEPQCPRAWIVGCAERWPESFRAHLIETDGASYHDPDARTWENGRWQRVTDSRGDSLSSNTYIVCADGPK